MLPGLLAYRPSWLKALAVNGTGHPADLGCMLAELGLTLAGSTGMSSHATDLGLCENLL